MPLQYEIDAHDPVVRVRGYGVVTLPELIQYFGRMLADDQLPPHFVEYVDFSGAEDLQFSYKSGLEFSTTWRRYKERGCLASVFFAPEELQFGIARMVQTLVEGSEHWAEGDLLVFRDHAAALAELKRKCDQC